MYTPKVPTKPDQCDCYVIDGIQNRTYASLPHTVERSIYPTEFNDPKLQNWKGI